MELQSRMTWDAWQIDKIFLLFHRSSCVRHLVVRFLEEKSRIWTWPA